MAYDIPTKEAMIRDLALYAGMQIKLRRVEMGMTLKDVSDMTGITPAALSKIERGETDMRLSTLALLRSALALDVILGPLGK